MSDDQAQANRPMPAQTNRPWYLLLLVAAWLAGRFLWRAFVPGGSWPMPPEHFIEMGLDALLLAILIALRVRVAMAGSAPVLWANVALAAGLVGGIGLLAIRLTSEAAWWTGHFSNAFPGS